MRWGGGDMWGSVEVCAPIHYTCGVLQCENGK